MCKVSPWPTSAMPSNKLSAATLSCHGLAGHEDWTTQEGHGNVGGRGTSSYREAGLRSFYVPLRAKAQHT